jgi:hypothetical protein
MWRTQRVFIVLIVLSAVWAIAAYHYDQYSHEQMIAEATTQCSDLDETEAIECRRSWRAALEKRLPLSSKRLSLMTALGPLLLAWLAGCLGLFGWRWLKRRRHQQGTLDGS